MKLPDIPQYEEPTTPPENFRPRSVAPVELGPIREEQVSHPERPMDRYLEDLYGDRKPVIEAEPVEEVHVQKFPLIMWGWAVWTLAFALLAIFLILFL
ncbi:MAG: hypothetical protein ACTHWJ_00390 [Flaviflexus sp.]|uniref:hypothetical protein n=1 Tax=Flaviflexus sp. TaxID=1969482 RepID=UPI003F8EED6A